MAIDTRSFFVGIGTVLAILAVGFGGGVMMGGVMSGADTKTPNKVERQAKDGAPDTKEIKPALQPVVVSPAAPAAPAPAPAEAAAAASAAASASASEPVPAQAAPAPPQIEARPLAPRPPPKPEPQPVIQAQPAPPPGSQPRPEPEAVKQAQPAPQPWQPPQRSQVTVHRLGPEKPVSLTQPGPDERALRDMSRREADKLKAQQRREERAQHREERRKQMAERRRQDELRRVERKPAAEPSLREVVRDDDEVQRPVARPRGFFGGFFRSPGDDDSGWR